MFPPFPELENDWREVLLAKPRAVVFFWAAWSPPDKMLFPVLERVAREFDEQIAFFAVDLDGEEAPSLASEYGITTNPALLFLRHGQKRAHVIGYIKGDQLRAKLNNWLIMD